MKTKTQIVSLLITLTQSTWTRPAVMLPTILLVLFGITGCQAPHH